MEEVCTVNNGTVNKTNCLLLLLSLHNRPFLLYNIECFIDFSNTNKIDNLTYVIIMKALEYTALFCGMM